MCDGLNGAGWKDSTIPKTGWTCIDIVDSKDGESGKPFEACEMSGTSTSWTTRIIQTLNVSAASVLDTWKGTQ